MKTIILFRHGKSDWDASYDRDHERPLAKRGIRDAERMGVFLSAENCVPDLCITSTAVRARTTMELAHKAGGWKSPIQESATLYEASPNSILNVIRGVSDSIASIILAGHEPTWSSMVAALTGGGSVRMPTAAMAYIDVDVQQWEDVSWGNGQLIWHMTPKSLAESDK